MHNGQISVHSEHERGTTFKVRLPITLTNLPKTAIYQEIVVTDQSEPAAASPKEESELLENDHPKTDRDVVLRAGRLRAGQLETRQQVVRGAREPAVLGELGHVRHADGENDADHEHRDQELVEREAALC